MDDVTPNPEPAGESPEMQTDGNELDIAHEAVEAADFERELAWDGPRGRSARRLGRRERRRAAVRVGRPDLGGMGAAPVGLSRRRGGLPRPSGPAARPVKRRLRRAGPRRRPGDDQRADDAHARADRPRDRGRHPARGRRGRPRADPGASAGAGSGGGHAAQDARPRGVAHRGGELS
jgi:hypothetical protein